MSSPAARLLLVHSPLVGPETWRPVAGTLASRGFATVVPSLSGVSPRSGGFWERCAQDVAAAAGGTSGQGVIVGHSGIGPVLPHIAAALDNVIGCVYVDASLPAPGACW